ncbi:hypothetical protein, partial [Granulicella aggregans]|uniref:hypothetical protein n=1 Tax=Granulicella aggregans TaxID=474949 RepID=UPI001C856DC4
MTRAWYMALELGAAKAGTENVAAAVATVIVRARREGERSEAKSMGSPFGVSARDCGGVGRR